MLVPTKAIATRLYRPPDAVWFNRAHPRTNVSINSRSQAIEIRCSHQENKSKTDEGDEPARRSASSPIWRWGFDGRGRRRIDGRIRKPHRIAKAIVPATPSSVLITDGGRSALTCRNQCNSQSSRGSLRQRYQPFKVSFRKPAAKIEIGRLMGLLRNRNNL